MSYTKLQSSIIASTIWAEPSYTRVVWITMLALADRNGYVAASVPGLAHIAHVTRPEVENALYTLMQPDPDSRSKVCEGRRIEEIDGGWTIINYVAVRDSWTDDDKRTYQREWVARKRAKEAVEVSRSESMHIEAPAPAPAPTPKNKRERRATALPPDFGLTPARIEYASKQNVLNVQMVMAAFYNHHKAKGTTMRDWDAAWRTWVLREAKFSARSFTPSPVSHLPVKKPASHDLYQEPEWMRK